MLDDLGRFDGQFYYLRYESCGNGEGNVQARKIFDKLKQTQKGAGGEIQLTDALEALMQEQAVYGYEFEGVRYDAGTTMGWLKASVELALQRPELAGEFRTYLQGLEL